MDEQEQTHDLGAILDDLGVILTAGFNESDTVTLYFGKAKTGDGLRVGFSVDGQRLTMTEGATLAEALRQLAEKAERASRN